MPREVIAGEPGRMPEPRRGGCGSKGMVLKLATIFASRSRLAAARPVICCGRKIEQHQMVVRAAGDEAEPAFA